MVLHFVASAIHGSMGTCFPCFSTLLEKENTAAVVSTLSIDSDVAKTRGDAPTLAEYGSAADIGYDKLEGVEAPPRKSRGRFNKIRTMSTSVKKGVLAAPPKKGALATTPKIGAIINTTQLDENSIIGAKTAFVGALNAHVKKN